MKSEPSGASGGSFKFDFENSVEPEISKNTRKTRRAGRSKTSLAIIIVAALVLISDGILVGVFVSRYLHRANERKTVPYTTPQNIEIKSFSYHKTEQVVSHADVYPKPIIPVKKDRIQEHIKEEKIQIYSWVDEKGIKHYSDTVPSVHVEKLSDRSR